jgi:hypothetical protein
MHLRGDERPGWMSARRAPDHARLIRRLLGKNPCLLPNVYRMVRSRNGRSISTEPHRGANAMKKDQMTESAAAATSAKPGMTFTITLRANGSALSLLAMRKPDGTAVTSVTTTGADKKHARGMTETHANMETAKAHVASLADKAEKLGWQRKARVIAARPDAFSKLPAAPKAVV